MAVLIAAAVLSLSAQITQATSSLTGWLLAAVPADHSRRHLTA
jgi:hypothetical protein